MKSFYDTYKQYTPLSSTKKGTFGLELECESLNRIRLGDSKPKYWNTVNDSSLRNHGIEFVFREPYNFEIIPETLKEFKSITKDSKFIEDSKTTSIHVHVNMLQEAPITIVNFMCLYYLFEQTLLKYSGPSRESNLFCLSLKDADGHFDKVLKLIDGINDGFPNALSQVQQDNKYSSLNVSSLAKFGSLEIRCFRGTTDTKEILNWVTIINDILQYSKQSGLTPPKLVKELAKKGSNIFFEVFTKSSKYLQKSFDEDLFFSNIWYITRISDLCNDWEHFSESGEIDYDCPEFKKLLNLHVSHNFLSPFEDLRFKHKELMLNTTREGYISKYGLPLRSTRELFKKKNKKGVKKSPKLPPVGVPSDDVGIFDSPNYTAQLRPHVADPIPHLVSREQIEESLRIMRSLRDAQTERDQSTTADVAEDLSWVNTRNGE